MNSELQRQFRQEMLRYLESVWRQQLGWADWQQQAESRIKGEVGDEQIEELRRYAQVAGKRILDVGAGYGEFLVSAKMAGAIPFGVEPDARRARLSRMRFMLNRMATTMCMGIGESLPFKDDSFDTVTLLETLEHARDPNGCIMEAVRVLKPGGLLLIMSPNYTFPLEPHYRIFWVPFLPRGLARIYLTLRAKNPSYIESIHYITLNSVLKSLKKAGIESVTNILEEKLQDPHFLKTRRWYLVAKAVQAAKALRISNRHLVNRLLPQIQLLAQKKGSIRSGGSIVQSCSEPTFYAKSHSLNGNSLHSR